MRDESGDLDILAQIEKHIDTKNLSPEDIKGAVEFADQHILENPEIPDYLVRKFRKPYPV